MSKAEAVRENIKRRTERSIEAGGDGYIDVVMLSFDVGLCPRKVRQILAKEVAAGKVKEKKRGTGMVSRFRFIV